MMELGDAFVQLQADYLKIRDEEDLLQKQRLRWLAFTEQWVARQTQLLESLGYMPTSAGQRMLATQASCIEATECVLDTRAPPKVAPIFLEEAMHQAPNLPEELRYSFTGPAEQPSATPAEVAASVHAQIEERRKNQHSTARKTLATLGMDVDDDDPSEEGPEEAAKTCMGSLLQHLNKRHMHHIVHHPFFDMVTCLLIFVSTLVNGWEVELLARDPKTADTIPFLDIQLSFSALFFVELVMRLMAYRWMFFFNKDWHWNLFDLLLVLLSLVELVFLIASPNEDEGFLSTVSTRMLRTARLIRNLRLIRLMRFFYELRLLLRAVFGSLKTLLWLGILLGMLLYFFALCFVSGVAEHLEDNPSLPDSVTELLRKEYGSLFSACLSLFKAVTGGDSWGLLLAPLQDIHFGLVLLYLAYIVFIIFAFMNAVTSVFVDNAMQAAQDEREHLVREKIREKESTMAKLESLFLESDHDHSGEISKEEFAKQLESEETMAYFKVIGIEAHDALTLFELIDENYSNSIEVHEFVKVCPRLMGPATAFDCAHAKHETQKLARWMGRFMEFVALQFEQVGCSGALKVNSRAESHKANTSWSLYTYGNIELSTADAVESCPLRVPGSGNGNAPNSGANSEKNGCPPASSPPPPLAVLPAGVRFQNSLEATPATRREKTS